LCMIPGTIIVVVGSDVITKGITQGRFSLELISVVAIAVIVLCLIAWYARRQYKEKIRK
jgi:uncharacterized membrane protein YdjX (TVP38/TMEM64 family)